MEDGVRNAVSRGCYMGIPSHRLILAREVVASVERCDWSDNTEGKVAVYCGALQMLSAACRPIYPYHLGMVSCNHFKVVL